MFPDPFAMETRAACDRQRRRAEADHQRRLALLPGQRSPMAGLRTHGAAIRGTLRRPSPWPSLTRSWRARAVPWDRPRLRGQEVE